MLQNLEINPSQAKILLDLNTCVRGFIGGFGAGKTVLSCLDGLFKALVNPGSYGMIVSPTYRMLDDTVKRTLFEICEQHGIHYRFHSKKEAVYIRKSGSWISFRSGEDPESLSGPNLT